MSMVINWVDESSTVEGTPVNRRNLMGMQGFFPGTIEITKVSEGLTTIRETSSEGVCTATITKGSGGERIIQESFVSANNMTIAKTTTIVKNGANTNITVTMS